MLYNEAFRSKQFNNDGAAHILSGVNANNGANTGSGLLYLFNGPVPVDVDTALDMVGTYTLLGTVKANAGANGLSFGAYAGGVLPKHASETWSTGVMAFTGFHTSGTLPISFARFCEGSDDGHSSSAGTAPRVQLTVSQIGSAPPADINLVANAWTSGASTFSPTGFELY